VGSAVEHGAKLIGRKLDFRSLFIVQEEDDEESASLADVLDVLAKHWSGNFTAVDVAAFINNQNLVSGEDEHLVREYLLPGVLPHQMFSAKSVGRLLKKHLDGPVKSGDRTLVLRAAHDPHTKVLCYRVRSS
jgi:hypothetical protein